MTRETLVQSQVESYQRLKKWYLMPTCLTLSIIRYGSRVKWSNPGKGVAPSSTPWCSSYRKGSLWVTLDYGHQLYLLISQMFKMNRSINLLIHTVNYYLVVYINVIASYKYVDKANSLNTIKHFLK